MKEKKMITVKERVRRDQFIQIPLLITLLYLIHYPIFMYTKYDIIPSQDYIARNSLLISFLSIFYTIEVYLMQSVVLDTYKKLLSQYKDTNKKIIEFDNPWYISSYVFTTFLYYQMIIRTTILAGQFDIFTAAEVTQIIAALVVLLFGGKKFKEAKRLIRLNSNKFTKNK